MDQKEQKKAPIIQSDSPILHIQCKEAFNSLTEQEKLYSYYFTRACWSGAKICYFQRSYESPALFYIFQKIFQQQSVQELETFLKQEGSFSEQEIKQLWVYVSAFFQNCGNYKSFGDTKFIPELSEVKFEFFLQNSKAFKAEKDKFTQIWNSIKKEIFEFQGIYSLIEMPDKGGLSSYYSPNISTDEAEKITKFLEQNHISPLNTRLIKIQENEFQVLVASADQSIPTQKFQLDQWNIQLIFGDFSSFLQSLNKSLEKTEIYAANQNQQLMVQKYLEHFKNGNIETHKDSQRHWIKDKGPVVETNLGFIESYLDPIKVRAEFEGFVSIQNKLESVKLNTLVQKAENLISQLPWGKDFEVEKFTQPDFTSLEILTFACSGTPVGINIPNYDDIRQTEGFKNVNLGNVYGTPNRENVLYLNETDKDLFVKCYKPSLFVIVALHELLGHGTGKLFSKNKDGTFNFDSNFINPLTGQKLTTYYDVNETWHGKFGEVSSGYEECRADGVALFLSCVQESLDILIPEFSHQEQEEIVYMAWIDIILGAIKGLEYYDVDQKKWGQAHIRAGYALFQVMLRAGEGLLQIEEIEDKKGDYLIVNLDRNKIKTVGKKAVGEFLRSVGDSVGGTEFFESYTQVPEDMIKYRKIALSRKLPRKIELMDDVKLVSEKQVEYVQFPKTFEGIIQSHVYHYQSEVEDVYEQWNKYREVFRCNK